MIFLVAPWLYSLVCVTSYKLGLHSIGYRPYIGSFGPMLTARFSRRHGRPFQKVGVRTGWDMIICLTSSSALQPTWLPLLGDGTNPLPRTLHISYNNFCWGKAHLPPKLFQRLGADFLPTQWRSLTMAPWAISQVAHP